MSPARLLALASFLIVSLMAPLSASAAQGDAVQAGEIRADSTLDSVGVLWFVDGDTNLNSVMTLDYRESGAITWLQAAPAMRAEPLTQVNGSPLGLNYWAASALFLDSGTAYELRVTLTDPDGGGTTTTITSTTTTSLTMGKAFRDLYVTPGSGGGSGSAADPYRGLQAAADQAQPGDLFHVSAGAYSPFTLTTSGTESAPIMFTGDDGATIDGSNTDRGVVTIGRHDQTTTHVSIHGLTIQNGRWGIDAQNTQYLDIIDNQIRDVDFGVYNRRDNDLERHQVVCDNQITGRTPWPGTGIPSERGIDLRGWGNTICHNEVSNFGDGVSMQPSTGPSYGNDVYGNDVSHCVDDGIEIDYNQANVRVWGNRVTNSRMGVSIQPIRGGPAYILRNELVNLESNSFKLNNNPSGLFVINNTVVKLDNALGEGSAGWTNTVFRNNAMFGTRYAFEFLSTPPRGVRSFDYNGWSTIRTGSDPWFKWEGTRYTRIADLPAGVEDHGVELSLGHLTNGAYPTATGTAIDPTSYDLRPLPGTPLIDSGQALPNVGDAWVSDGQPDLGAYELGQGLPDYGPRTTPDPGGGNTTITVDELASGQLSDQMSRLYRAYFLRDPDAGGLAFWRTQRATGSSLGSVSNHFSQSDEFQGRYGSLTDAAFVDLVYENVLGRPPEAAGRAYWISLLTSGLSRGELMIGFSESPEFVTSSGTARPSTITEGRIWRLYRAYFLRDADQSGFDFWVGLVRGGATVGAISGEFTTSAEFQTRYGSLSDGEFVDLVYENVLGRSPDAAGAAFWNSRLASGLSRGELMIGFSDSAEFILTTDSIPPA